jgi:hypothetical protein
MTIREAIKWFETQKAGIISGLFVSALTRSLIRNPVSASRAHDLTAFPNRAHLSGSHNF